MKKKKTVIVQYRLRPDVNEEKFWYFLYSKEWTKWNSYYTEKGANEAITRQSKKFNWLEYRLKPQGENNGKSN